MSLHTETTTFQGILDLLMRFSCWSKAISVMAGLQRLPNGLKGSYQQIVKDNEQKDLSLDLLNIVPLKTLSTPLTQQQQFPE